VRQYTCCNPICSAALHANGLVEQGDENMQHVLTIVACAKNHMGRFESIYNCLHVSLHVATVPAEASKSDRASTKNKQKKKDSHIHTYIHAYFPGLNT